MQQCCKILRCNVASVWPGLYAKFRGANIEYYGIFQSGLSTFDLRKIKKLRNSDKCVLHVIHFSCSKEKTNFCQEDKMGVSVLVFKIRLIENHSFSEAFAI